MAHGQVCLTPLEWVRGPPCDCVTSGLFSQPWLPQPFTGLPHHTGTSFPWLITFLASGYLLRPCRVLDPGEVLETPPQEQTLLSPYHTGDIPGWGRAGRNH